MTASPNVRPRISRSAWCLGAIACVACGGGDFTSADGAGGGGEAGGVTAASTGGAGAGGAAPIDAGCADGHREEYLDAAQVEIAACAGGFSEPGVHTVATRMPQCSRTAGDDGDNPNGNGCSIADLCAEGWHVCENAAEVAQRSADAQCPPPAGAEPLFWLTRQAQDAVGACGGPLAENNLVGCGQVIGQSASDASCSPLDRELRHNHCEASAVWFCGAMATSTIEAQLVHKTGPQEGGVLCCID